MDVNHTAWVIESRPQNISSWTIDRTLSLPYLIISFLIIIISLVGMAGNAVVICLLCFCMQRNVFSVYILNLAGADLLYLLTWMLYAINVFVHRYNLSVIYFPKVFSRMSFTPYVASLSILTAISTERCVSVLQPIWYRCRRPKHMSSILCVLLWALSLLLTILRTEFDDSTSGNFYQNLKSIDFSIATWRIFSFVLLFGYSLVLLTRLLYGFRKRKLSRIYVTIGLTVLVFLFCGLPSGMCWFLFPWMSIMRSVHNIILFLVIEVLSCVNSCVNPIIYFFVGTYRQQQRQQRRSLKLILQIAFQDGPEETGHQVSPSHEIMELSRHNHRA